MTLSVDLLVAATRCARPAVAGYLLGRHINPSTRALLEVARVRLGLPRPPPHATCAQCANRAHADGKVRRDLAYRYGGSR